VEHIAVSAPGRCLKTTAQRGPRFYSEVIPMSQRPTLFTGVVLAIALSGCEKGPPAGAPMAKPFATQGKITFPNDSPLRGGVVTFIPVEVQAGSEIRYEGAALVDAKGMYKIGFNGDASGVPAGEYMVTIKPRDYQELANSNSGRIPEKYRDQSTTSLKVTVTEQENTFNFVLR
jgi:hypothetical protein